MENPVCKQCNPGQVSDLGPALFAYISFRGLEHWIDKTENDNEMVVFLMWDGVRLLVLSEKYKDSLNTVAGCLAILQSNISRLCALCCFLDILC